MIGRPAPVLLSYGGGGRVGGQEAAADGPRIQPGSIIAAQAKLPSYQSLAYAEKVGTLTLIVLALGYLLVRGFEVGPKRAIREMPGRP